MPRRWDDRPKLREALHRAKVTGATLVIAKLDRLSRNLAFIAALQDSGAKFVAADMPEANETMIQFMAVIAQHERKMISTRTKAALAAARVRGKRLGNPNLAALQAIGAGKRGWTAGADSNRAGADRFARDVLPVVEAIRADGITSLEGIASALNGRGILTARGAVGTRRWSAISLSVRSGDDGWPHDNVLPLIAIVSRDEATASWLARYFSHTRAGVRLGPGEATDHPRAGQGRDGAGSQARHQKRKANRSAAARASQGRGDPSRADTRNRHPQDPAAVRDRRQRGTAD
jgi:DNA invertase Pin-like site-specific DNA recombinase